MKNIYFYILGLFVLFNLIVTLGFFFILKCQSVSPNFRSIAPKIASYVSFFDALAMTVLLILYVWKNRQS
jgi:hypothetical protein